MQVCENERRFRAITIGRALVATLVGVTTAAAVESRFDSNAEGWTISDDGGPAEESADYVGAGGNPGGFIQHSDGLFPLDDWYFRAPAKFHGNFSTVYGGSLTYDLRQDDTGEGFSLNEIYLRGGGLTLTYQTSPPGTSWTPYAIPLVETAGWELGGSAPTFDQMVQVLSDVTDLQIRGEFQLGLDVGDLDNVVLGDATDRLPGDYNRDRVVDMADYNVWRQHFGSRALLLADGSGNGAVDLADYTVWRDHLGAVQPELRGQAVPEPTAWLLGLAAAGCGLVLRWGV